MTAPATRHSSLHAPNGGTAWMAGQDGEPLRAPGSVVHVGAGREIFAEGQDAEMFYKVASGVVRVCKFLADGRRQIEAFHAEGEIFGLETGGVHTMSAEAVNDSTLVAYRRNIVENLARHDTAVSGQLFRLAIRSLAQAQNHALLLGRHGAPEKVASFLLAMSERAAGRVIRLAMTRQDIADYLGLTIETVSRSFSQFARDGLIALPNVREVRLTNVVALRDIAA